jgi:hypothetical protein
MLKQILASTALATLLASGAYAQTEPATDESATPSEMGAQDNPANNEAEPEIVEDETVAPDATATEVVDDAVPTAGGSENLATDEAAPMEADTMATDEAPLDDKADVVATDGEWEPVIDLATVSTDKLIGADIVTASDETVASITDVIISDDGDVESLVAQFGGFLGFGADRVLLTMDEVEVLQDQDENLVVRTSLTPESIESRPDYE